MNYIRGAVSAISAPYHYYNQINPSTLTGAIDVIVIQRTAQDGATELACSPFHVRFGKWQVLRPSDKHVSVSVNGILIPFNMKIGEAGEAFFVFETDEDVPRDLITSPVLLPTRPDADASEQGTVATAEQSPSTAEDREQAHPEPEFLDLDAVPGVEGTPKPTHDIPQYARLDSSTSRPNGHDDRSMSMTEQDQRVDDLLASHRTSTVKSPDVEYHKDVVMDIEGYHASSQTPKNSFTFPSFAERSVSCDCFPDTGLSGFDQHHLLSSEQESHPFPSVRATSEPPPDTTPASLNDPSPDTAPESSVTSPGPSPSQTPPLVHSHPKQRHLQEYSWEWGAFPTRSPLKAVFPSVKGKEKVQTNGDTTYFDPTEEGADVDKRSGGKSWKKRRRKSQVKHKAENDVDLLILGSGRIRPDESDSTKYILEMDGHEVGLELSIVGDSNVDLSIFHELDMMEAARVFDQGKVPFQDFLDDETVVRDERLIIKWADFRYITPKDDSAFLNVLEGWRNVALQHRERHNSAISDITEEPHLLHARSKSEPPEETRPVVETAAEAKKDRIPTKSSRLSWAWWRSRKVSGNVESKDRPVLKGSISSPAAVPIHAHDSPKTPKPGFRPALEPVTPRQQFISLKKKYVKTLRLTSDQLKALDLKPGANSITFSLSASGVIACTARIFVWNQTDKVVISDIDGTITKSDGLGHVFAMIGRDWTHLGVAKLYTDIARNGYKIMYLTSRAIGQADATRYYLKGIKQNDYNLPEGPVVMSPDRLIASLHREVIMRKPEVFKMACLRDIRNLFGEARNPFYAGFGNRITDALSYRSVNVPSSRIFTINSSGEVKLELLELAGYKSSYIHMTDLVDQMFPPINQKWTPEYTDFNFWRTPVPDIPLPDLTPPSPALSARSDGSTKSALARLRNFSLAGGSKSTRGNTPSDDLRNNVHMRQMTSLERLSSSLVNGLRRSISSDSRSESSVTYAESDSGSEVGEWEVDVDGKKRRRRERRRSIGSMPGSLDDIHFFGLDDYEEEPVFGEFEEENDGHVEDEYGDGEMEEEDVIADEQALEEDLFVAGEMENVPFL